MINRTAAVLRRVPQCWSRYTSDGQALHVYKYSTTTATRVTDWLHPYHDPCVFLCRANLVNTDQTEDALARLKVMRVRLQGKRPSSLPALLPDALHRQPMVQATLLFACCASCTCSMCHLTVSRRCVCWFMMQPTTWCIPTCLASWLATCNTRPRCRVGLKRAAHALWTAAATTQVCQQAH